jgi:hypothetical protein
MRSGSQLAEFEMDSPAGLRMHCTCQPFHQSPEVFMLTPEVNGRLVNVLGWITVIFSASGFLVLGWLRK